MRRGYLVFGLGLLAVTATAQTSPPPQQPRQPAQFRARPPELRQVEKWINSPPLTLTKLRGQVVVLHFWTFG